MRGHDDGFLPYMISRPKAAIIIATFLFVATGIAFIVGASLLVGDRFGASSESSAALVVKYNDQNFPPEDVASCVVQA